MNQMNEITRSYSEEKTGFGYLITLIVYMQIISSNYKRVFRHESGYVATCFEYSSQLTT